MFEAAAKPAPKPADTEAKVDAAEETPPKPKSSVAPKPQAAAKVKVAETQPAHAAENYETATDWFCIASGEKCGPLGFEELKALARDGSLRGRDRVWRGSWPKFQMAADIEGLETG